MSRKKIYLNASLATCIALSPALIQAGTTSVSAEASVKPKLVLEKKQKKVRVVVELVGDPAIAEAAQKGKKFNELSKSEQNKAQQSVQSEQKRAKSALKKQGVTATPIEEFTTVFNGFSTFLSTSEIAKVEALPEVATVHIVNEYERPEVKPDMITSNGMVQAEQTWGDYGFAGEGTVVAVIDSGIDPEHRDYKITDAKTAELTQSEVNQAITSFGLPGEYVNEKVPYAYNYYDENDDIKDDSPGASMHGQHVSGTVAANGDLENGGIKGVAPEAQILGLKVFSNDPNYASTYGDIYIKAIDDAIKLGADVINMSLGSTAGFVDADSPEQQAVQRAVDNGIFMSISAGNSAYFGHGFDLPTASNPDTGVVGSPSVSPGSTSVASLENNQIQVDAFRLGTQKIGWKKQDGPQFKDGTYDIVFVGDGQPENYEGKDVKGKLVLAVRDDAYYYANIQKTAETQGAAGVLIRPRIDHGDYTSMALNNPIIPIASLSIKDGNDLRDRLLKDGAASVTFASERMSVNNRSAGAMSDFTSWGVTPNLDFKPELSAPGGQIFSTLNDNQYGLMSGTSMAAPHVAGGAALVLERVDRDFKLSGKARVTMAKNLLLNTSKPVTDIGPYNQELKQSLPYSPRRAGAGLMQLHAAVTSPAVAYEKSTKEAKVALKELSKSKASFTVVVENMSNEALTYDVAASLQTDLAVKNKDGIVQNAMEAQALEQAIVKINGSNTNKVTLKAKQKKEITVSIDVSKAKVLNPDTLEGTVSAKSVFENGYFVDGFLRLTDPSGTDGHPSLVVPFVGFEGDWGKAPIFDETIYGEGAFYGVSGLVDANGNYLGEKLDESVASEAVAISPDGDGSKDTATPVFSLLRNAKDVKYRIVDEKGNVLRTLKMEDELRKNYFDGGKGDYYYYAADNAWDGQLNGKMAPKGTYYYEIEASIDYMKKQAQTMRIPVKVDYTDPRFTLRWNDNVASVKASDDFAGINGIEFLLNGEVVAKEAKDAANFTLEQPLASTDQLSVRVSDNAGNVITRNVSTENDVAKPGIFVDAPLAFSPYGTSIVPLIGQVKDDSEIASFTVDGVEVPLTYDATAKQYTFNTTRTFKDGYHKVRFVAEDTAGNVTNFVRPVFVDSTKAKLSVTNVPKNVSSKQNSVKVKVQVTDNFDEIKLRVNGDLKWSNTLKEPYAMRAFSRTGTITLPVTAKGKNTFTFEVTDLGGNVTKKVITINKK